MLRLIIADDIHYVTLEGKEKTIADICKEAQNADHIYFAPDPDREGEIIAWHVEQEVERVVKDKSIIKRITFNEITKPAIEDAIAHPFSILILIKLLLNRLAVFLTDL